MKASKTRLAKSQKWEFTFCKWPFLGRA